jgi:hypothetical protein
LPRTASSPTRRRSNPASALQIGFFIAAGTQALIHRKEDEGSIDPTGYIIGLYDEEQGKTNLVHINSLRFL